MTASAASEWAGASVCQGPTCHSYDDLLRATASIAAPARSARIAIHVPDGPLTAAALLWARRNGAHAALLPAEIDAHSARTLAASTGCGGILHAEEGPALRLTVESLPGAARDDSPGVEPSLLLFTSGTAGEPKKVRHSWSSLSASVTYRPALRDARWMALYPLTRYAGLNTTLHALRNGSPLIVPDELTAAAIVSHLERWKPTHVAGTPTLWRLILMSLPRNAAAIGGVRQITLGGEIADQAILNALERFFPGARITHVYATTELGVCLSVSDRRAGFPASWLGQETGGVTLRVDRSELFVRRAGPVSSALEGSLPDGWWATGDRVEIRGERVLFLGRESDLINVGGAKVDPGEVEGCLAEVAGVAAARVSGRPSSVSGTLLVAEVLPEAGTDPKDLRRRIVEHCRSRLPRHAWPRTIDLVDSLPLGPSGKIVRRNP